MSGVFLSYNFLKDDLELVDGPDDNLDMLYVDISTYAQVEGPGTLTTPTLHSNVGVAALDGEAQVSFLGSFIHTRNCRAFDHMLATMRGCLSSSAEVVLTGARIIDDERLLTDVMSSKGFATSRLRLIGIEPQLEWNGSLDTGIDLSVSTVPGSAGISISEVPPPQRGLLRP